MKPRFYHYFIAHLPAIAAQGCGILFVAGVFIQCAPVFDVPHDITSLALVVLGGVAAYALGALIGTVFLARLAYPLACQLMGAPLMRGDFVFILRGRRHGKIAPIYEVWTERGEVRVRLSDNERECAADVYACHEVLKIKQPQKSLQSNRS